MNWPDETAIDLTGHNGEVDTINRNGVEYRINPVGAYALYFKSGKWLENASVTNEELQGICNVKNVL